MEPTRHDVPEADRTARQEILSFLATRYELASTILRDQQWESYRSFVQLWLETYDWRSEDSVARYLELNPDQRTARFERFRRQASSWDVTLEFPLDESGRRGEERARWRREFAGQRRRMKDREERDASHWESVQRMLDSENAVRTVPAGLREAFALLELPPEATLAEARRRYRELARKLHPDVSGRPTDMVALNEAWERIAEFFLS